MLRSLFSDRIGVYNGVAVRDVPWNKSDDTFPNAKAPLVETIRDVIKPDDRVIHVGGGVGIAAVRTAQWAYRGEVVVYEPAAEMVIELKRTRDLNAVDFEIIEASVGEPRNPYGNTAGAKQYETGDLNGDLLVLDCEGAELDILPAPQFDHVVVETHPGEGSTTETIQKLMSGGEFVREKIAGEPGGFVVR